MSTREAQYDQPPIPDRIFSALEQLAKLERVAGSGGEHAAARRLTGELRSRGARAWIENEQVHGTYWVPIGLSCAVAAVAAAVDGNVGAAMGALAAVSVVDDLEIGRRPLRRLLRQRTTSNVVAEVEPERPGRHAHVLVVHAHHDAARSGLVFHPALAKLAARAAGGAIERVGGTPAPMWGAAAGPAAVAIGALLRVRRLRRLGAALSAGYAAAMLDVASRPAVPGANDNLSGVAVVLWLAEALSRRPTRSLRVLLLSTGSEESFLEAMTRFGERHFGELPREATTFLCMESVGSPDLMLLSGEGLLRLQRYPPAQIETLTELAARSGIPLRSPFRYRLATDGQVPLRAGYPTAVISSMDWYKAPSNYHWPSDQPQNLNRQTVALAARLTEEFVRDLDRRVSRQSSSPHPGPRLST
jgi:Peptidase family M28